MQVSIAVSAPNKPEREVKISKDVVVGRGKTANLRIISNEVSREHCRLIVSDELVAVQDLGSSNGTQLNGKTIESNAQVLLSSGSHLEVGPLNLVVRFDESLLPQSFADSLKSQNAPLDALDELVQTSTQPTPTFGKEDLEEPIFDELEGVDQTEITEPSAVIEIDALPDTVAMGPAEIGEPDTETISEPETTIDSEPAPAEGEPRKLKGLFGLFRRAKKADTPEDKAIETSAPEPIEATDELLEPLPLEPLPLEAGSEEPAAELLPLEPTDESAIPEINPPPGTEFFPPQPEEEWDEEYLDGAEPEDEEDEEQGDIDPGFADFLNDIEE